MENICNKVKVGVKFSNKNKGDLNIKCELPEGHRGEHCGTIRVRWK